MKISLNELTPRRRLEITGDEAWLGRLYSDFPVTQGPAPRITGVLTLTKEEAGSVAVEGKLAYAPMVACSRCDLPVPWPLTLSINARYLPPEVNSAPRERNLSRADLDAYYLEDDAVDLEELINDAVQTSLPSRTLATDERGETCRICHADLREDRVYGTKGGTKGGTQGEAGDGSEGEASPFAVLKGLRLPK